MPTELPRKPSDGPSLWTMISLLAQIRVYRFRRWLARIWHRPRRK